MYKASGKKLIKHYWEKFKEDFKNEGLYYGHELEDLILKYLQVLSKLICRFNVISMKIKTNSFFFFLKVNLLIIKCIWK